GAEHFFQIERIPFGSFHYLFANVCGEVLDVEQVAKQFAGLREIEWFELEPLERTSQACLQSVDKRPARCSAVGAQHTNQQQGIGAGECCDLRNQLECGAI